MAQGSSLADELIKRDTVAMLAAGFAGIVDPQSLVDEVMADIEPLALMDRLRHIATLLERHLSPDFPTMAAQIEAALPAPLDPDKRDDDFGHFIFATLGIIIERHALNEHFECGMDLLSEITKRFSMEFSLRAFIVHDTQRSLARATQWASSDNYHLRRLASEGTRPRLPWGQKVPLTPADTLPILDQLHADPTRYVVRSVANHLNDITKIDPDIVLDQLDAWVETNQQTPAELLWLRKHALRGLIKSGHPRAMTHLGYAPDVALGSCQITVPAAISRGDKAPVQVTLTSRDDASLIVDYIIYFQKSNGQTSPKTFKLKTINSVKDIPITLTKMHHFKDNSSTFKLFSGPHRIELQVNGRIVTGQDFDLT